MATSRPMIWRAAQIACVVGLAAAMATCGRSASHTGPIAVSRADGDAGDAGALAQDAARPPAGTGGSAIWVMDANDVPVGVLVRRGSDADQGSNAYYDIVTVYDPASGLFFQITMSDGVVRMPGETFFSDANCTVPVGLAMGACENCHAGYGVGILAGGRWWTIAGGSTATQITQESMLKGGVGAVCSAHGANNTMAFLVVPVTGITPPTQFAPPLHFLWR